MAIFFYSCDPPSTPTYTTTVRGQIVSPARFQDASKGSTIAEAEVWANPTKKVKTKADGSYELKVTNHSGTFTITANYTNPVGKYKQSNPQTVKTTSPTHSLNIPLQYGFTSTVKGGVMLWPSGVVGGIGGRRGDDIKVFIEVEGIRVDEGTVGGALSQYEIPNVSHNGMVIATTDYTGDDFKNQTISVGKNSNESIVIGFDLVPPTP